MSLFFLILISFSLRSLAIASSSEDYLLYEQFRQIPGRHCSTDTQKFRAWADTREIAGKDEISILLINDGPEEAFVSEYVFCYYKTSTDTRLVGTSMPRPRRYVLLPSSGGQQNLLSTAIFRAKVLSKDDSKPGMNLLFIFEVIRRSDGTKQRMEVEFE